ncbi:MULTISPECIES: peptidylprolyl isomerase [unclassified Nodularia (in: cyanobacteria)]|uniref:peptidylprolyl isomerase n=1 Tax=unclassified Nodularia (in: cyanobacteria) TaxID=2656917 RepID=UPI00188219E9|nr:MULTISPECIES: peptidylprolyl isomerase [unclassified Nodularia (in: cyanobacteria)]MBE9199036.1 peptidylprolyl isomerase [Nodularia sp. LEGE 06071]MCC2695275.1 peptidylprolyl isomerase [Nodularia sp. LEGE 04288]
MSQILTISGSDIIHSLKLSSQVPGLVEAIASQKIVAEVAERSGITVTPEEIQEEGDQLRLAKKLVKAQDTLIWLEKNYLSVNEFEESVHNKILSKKLANSLFNSEVERFFYQHQLDYVAAITYEIIFDDKDLALEMFYAMEEGEISFPEIARLYIPEPELRSTYGYQGRRHRKDFRPEIAAAVFAATPPQILKPIATSKGVYLIWVEEISQPQLDESLREKIITELFTDWLKQQIECMEIITQLDSDTLQPEKELLKQS